MKNNLKARIYSVPTARFIGETPEPPELTIEQVQSFIKKTPDALGSIVTDDVIVKALDGNKALNDSLFDKRVTSAIKTYEQTYKDTKLPEIIEARYKELHPDESAESIELREMRAELEASKRNLAREGLSKIALTKLGETKVDGAGLLESFVIGETEEETTSNVANLMKVIDIIAKAEAKKIAGAEYGREDVDEDGKPIPNPNKTEIDKLITEMDEHIKNGKTQEAVKIQMKIHRLRQQAK